MGKSDDCGAQGGRRGKKIGLIMAFLSPPPPPPPATLHLSLFRSEIAKICLVENNLRIFKLYDDFL
jgi:hypothetical protein